MKNIKLIVIACLLVIIIPVNTISANSESYEWGHYRTNNQAYGITKSSNSRTNSYVELRTFAYNGKNIDAVINIGSGYGEANTVTNHLPGYSLIRTDSSHSWSNRSTSKLSTTYSY